MSEAGEIRPPIDGWLRDWAANRRDEVLARLARPSIRDHAAVRPRFAGRIDSAAAVLVLREFLDLLPAEEAGAALDRLIERHPACRHAWAWRAEQALNAGRAEAAIADLRRAMVAGFDDLHVQRLLIAAYGTLPPETRSPEIGAALRPLEGRFCGKPFTHFETTESGDVYACCPSYLPVPIGNIHHAGVEEIWNSPVAQELRRSVLEGDFRYCSRLSCPAIQAGRLPSRAAIEKPVAAGGGGQDSMDSMNSMESKERARLHEYVTTGATKLRGGPGFVNLSHDRSCNLSCPSCRTRTIIAKSSEQEKLDAVRDRVVLPVLKTASRVLITGSGDPFGSKHFRDVLDHLNPRDFPELRVNLQTNGQLFTQREWTRLAGLHAMIGQVYVSIDAAAPDTYAEVRRGGSFATLCANMDFIAALRRAGRIRRLVIAFVVQACNFRQMEDFVELGRRWQVDLISFSRLRQWGTYEADDFARRDVFAPTHPEHAAFRAVLESPVFAEPFVWLGNITSFMSPAAKARRARAPRAAAEI